MLEKTYEACLKKQLMPDLEALLYRLDAEEFGEDMRKDDMIRAAAALIPEQLEDIVCALRMEQVAALRGQLAGNAEGAVSLRAANRDADLAQALKALSVFALAWREASCWRVRSCVSGMLREAADVEIRFADLIADAVQGMLMHVGMLPREELTSWLLKQLDNGEAHAAEAIGEMADRVLRLRYGLDALYAGREGIWVVSEDVLAPDALYTRLQEPHIARLPWLDYRVEELVFDVRASGVPGPGDVYLPLANWLHGHGMPLETCADFIIHAVQAIQNGLADRVLPQILHAVQLRDDADTDNLFSLMNRFCNSIPLWDNKGRSADEMMRTLLNGKE